jgi:hypothetical protein
MNAKQIRHALRDYFDTVRVAKDGSVVCRRSFFYTSGCSAEKLAAAVKSKIAGAQISEAREQWNQWPRESYFRVAFTVAPAAVLS